MKTDGKKIIVGASGASGTALLIAAGPASGSYKTEGMIVVPCSMKTAAGINCGYSDNLLLRAAGVTLKEHRKLVLAVRESPMSAIHLRNLSELSLVPGVIVVPPVLTFYNHPKTIEDMINSAVARLLEPFGLEIPEYKRWK